MSDSTPAPADFTISAVADGEFLRLQIASRATDGSPPDPMDSSYRKLAWSDVEALAGAEDVTLTRADDQVTLEFVILDD